jgi:hypothetical protein
VAQHLDHGGKCFIAIHNAWDAVSYLVGYPDMKDEQR